MPLSDIDRLSSEGLAEALAALRAGELVVFPSETFYGIAADPMQPHALERIFALKGRQLDQPIALIAADKAAAFALARKVPEQARRLACTFWPGPLTLVLAAREGLHPALIGPSGGVGVRLSPHPVARQLAQEAAAGLITATSANLAGQPPARTIVAARQSLGSHVRVYLDGGRLEGRLPSTVVDFAPDGSCRILRSGAIEQSAIVAALKEPK